MIVVGLFGLLVATVVNTPRPMAPSALQSCIDTSVAARLESWVCGPFETRSGTVRPVASTPLIDDPFEVDDVWCENAGICHQVRSPYLSFTRGKGAYGNATGVIGSFDVTLRTSLSGRQPRWTLSLVRTSGPPIQFFLMHVDCWEDVSFLPDPTCGSIDPGGPLVASRWRSSLLFGPRLNDANEYYAVVNGEFAPEGRQIFTLGALQSLSFTCPEGDDGCTFPPYPGP